MGKKKWYLIKKFFFNHIIGFQLNDHHIAPRYTKNMIGEPISVKKEIDIFKILKLDYKKPEERDL